MRMAIVCKRSLAIGLQNDFTLKKFSIVIIYPLYGALCGDMSSHATPEGNSCNEKMLKEAAES